MPTDLNQTRIPRMVPGCDLRSLPLTPTEAFVLSRIDGTVSVGDLSLLTGLEATEVASTLDRLASLGAVAWDGAPPDEQRSTRTERAEESTVVRRAMRETRHPAVETRSSTPSGEDDPRSPSLYDPAELDEECDIPPDRRRRILDAFYQLDELSHYELLGVEETATKKEIKTAYFELAAEYHPDRYFRKHLGTFKQKMEMVFSRVTQAHDTLTRKQSRADYDAYLATQQRTRHMERVLRGGAMPPERDSTPPRSAREAHARGPQSSRSSGVVSRQDAATKPPMPAAAPPTPPAPEAPRRSSSIPVRTKEDERARREAFAARLSGGRVSKFPAARKTPPAEPNPRATMPREQAAEALRRHMVERRQHARDAQLKRFVDAASEAMERGDPAAASNSYRLAMQFAPDDEEIKRAYEDADRAATVALADGYLRQGEYEERAERWREAARSYARAADGMPNHAHVQNKAAHAMLRADLDLRKAADYAKRATGLEPNNAEYHVNLGKIYLAAGLALNAKREIELAAELAPEDAKIARLLGAVRTG